VSGSTFNVLFDHQAFEMQRVGGVSRSFSRCARYLNSGPSGPRVWVGCLVSSNEHLRQDDKRFRRTYLLSRISPRAARAANRALSKHLSSRADILHPTWYFPASLPDGGGPPVVATVHDMIPELFPDLFPSGNPHHAKQAYCRRADLLVCVSEHTRADLIRLYGVPKQRTRVVYHGIDLDEELRDVSQPRATPDNYILFVGKRQGYKDFSIALEAFARLRRRFPELHLICIGGGVFSTEEREAIARLGVSRFVRQSAATDPELRGWYRGASAFVYPSRYEGFGIPILEAFAQGCPTVLARSSCFPEVAQDAALYFQQGDAESCADAVLQVLSEKNSHRVRLGRERCRDFTWTRSSQALAAVYRELL
jgi:glycosyltransferase involved in cell wall biosynthesis